MIAGPAGQPAQDDGSPVQSRQRVAVELGQEDKTVRLEQPAPVPGHDLDEPWPVPAPPADGQGQRDRVSGPPVVPPDDLNAVRGMEEQFEGAVTASRQLSPSPPPAHPRRPGWRSAERLTCTASGLVVRQVLSTTSAGAATATNSGLWSQRPGPDRPARRVTAAGRAERSSI